MKNENTPGGLRMYTFFAHHLSLLPHILLKDKNNNNNNIIIITTKFTFQLFITMRRILPLPMLHYGNELVLFNYCNAKL